MDNLLAQLGSAIGWLPEIPLAIGAMGLLMIGVFHSDRNKAADSITWAAVILLAGLALFLFAQPEGVSLLFNQAYVADGFTRFMKLLALGGAAATLALGVNYFRDNNLHRFEYPVLALLATLGMMIMISANDLISLYVGLELQSLALYVMAAFNRESSRSSEAGLKYFVLGALSSGMLLYGCSLIYGFTGSTNFTVIAGVLTGLNGKVGLGLLFGLVLLFVGLAFKISAVPFHMWTPDVYEGAPTPATSFFAAAPKIAAMALFIRVALAAFPAITSQWQQIIIFMSMASMVLGAFAAIGQSNIKRLMAYSSIGHMGFALSGLAAGSVEGTQGVLVYMAIYMIMTLGTFACILSMRRSENMVEDIQQLAGLGRNSPAMAFLLAMLLFSLAGIPPLAGFFAKFYVFLAVIKAGLYPLAIVGVLSSVVGAYYYLRIVKIMYFDETVDRFDPMPNPARFVLGVSGLFVLFYVIMPAWLIEAAGEAARALPLFAQASGA